MNRLQELYSLAFNCNCFKEAYKRGDFDFQQALTLENDNIDATLLALTVVQKLYHRLETVHCPYLKIITNGMVFNNCLMESLIKFLDHSDQHVVFSATKTLVLVFQTLSKQMINEEWFQTLFTFGRETEHPWRKIYTMDLLSKILTNSKEPLKKGNEISQQQMNSKKCSCILETWSVIATPVSRTELVDLFLESFNLRHNLFHFIPFIVRPNGLYSFMRSCKHNIPAEDFVLLQACLKLGDAIHNQENVKREDIVGTKENNLVAYLHCIAAIAKYLGDGRKFQSASTADVRNHSQNENYFLKSHESESLEHTGENKAELCEAKTDSTCAGKVAVMHTKDATVNQLCIVMATLAQYLHYPRLPSQIFKKILEVLNQIIVIPVFNEKSKVEKFGKIVRKSSISFLSVVECCLLHKIPRCSGLVGFAGTKIRSCNELFSCTDVVALRKASLLVFKSSFVVLNLATKQEGSLLLQKLSLSCVSLWCSGILSLTPDSFFNNKPAQEHSNKSEIHNCLVTLFVDQDDDLVEVMLLLLLLCQEINRTVSSRSEISDVIFRQLNPHLLFMAFAESIQFDHSLLLDLLISSETRFLEYLVKYLHFVINGWDLFVQILAEYKKRNSCNEKQAWRDELSTCSLRQMELESDAVNLTEFVSCVSNKDFQRKDESLFAEEENYITKDVELSTDGLRKMKFKSDSRKPTEFVRCAFNEGCQRKDELLFAEEKNSIAKDACLETPEVVSREAMFDIFQKMSEVCQPDFRLQETLSTELNGLTSIGLAYSSSDESEMETETENESDHEIPVDSKANCINICFRNNLAPSPLAKEDSLAKVHSSFAITSYPVFGQDISQEPRENTDNLSSPLSVENSNFFTNELKRTQGLNDGAHLDNKQSTSSSAKAFLQSEKDTKTRFTKGSDIKERCGNSTVPKNEILDKVMTMLIRLRLSVQRLSSGGHFPYSAAPLITLMENVEKFYDDC